MVVDVVFAVLDALLESRDEILGIAVFVEILEPVDEVGVLREVQVFFGLALLAHLSTRAVFEGTHERN